MFIEPIELPFFNVATYIAIAVVLVVIAAACVIASRVTGDVGDVVFVGFITTLVSAFVFVIGGLAIHDTAEQAAQLEGYTQNLVDFGYVDPVISEDLKFTASLNGEYVRGALVEDDERIAVLTIIGPEVEK